MSSHLKFYILTTILLLNSGVGFSAGMCFERNRSEKTHPSFFMEKGYERPVTLATEFTNELEMVAEANKNFQKLGWKDKIKNPRGYVLDFEMPKIASHYLSRLQTSLRELKLKIPNEMNSAADPAVKKALQTELAMIERLLNELKIFEFNNFEKRPGFSDYTWMALRAHHIMTLERGKANGQNLMFVKLVNKGTERIDYLYKKIQDSMRLVFISGGQVNGLILLTPDMFGVRDLIYQHVSGVIKVEVFFETQKRPVEKDLMFYPEHDFADHGMRSIEMFAPEWRNWFLEFLKNVDSVNDIFLKRAIMIQLFDSFHEDAILVRKNPMTFDPSDSSLMGDSFEEAHRPGTFLSEDHAYKMWESSANWINTYGKNHPWPTAGFMKHLSN